MHLTDLSVKVERNFEFVTNETQFCDCLPVCSDLTYEVETSQTDWEWEKWIKAERKNITDINELSQNTREM